MVCWLCASDQWGTANEQNIINMKILTCFNIGTASKLFLNHFITETDIKYLSSQMSKRIIIAQLLTTLSSPSGKTKTSWRRVVCSIILSSWINSNSAKRSKELCFTVSCRQYCLLQEVEGDKMVWRACFKLVFVCTCVGGKGRRCPRTLQSVCT